MSNKQTNLDILLEHGFDIRSRVIYIQDEIDKELSNKFIKILNFIDKTSGDITIILDSEGGCVTRGFKMYDAIKSCSNDVTIKVVGAAMSIASVILQAADTRIITENSKLMIHRGSMEVEGHFTDVKRAVAENEEDDKRCAAIYLEKIREVKPEYKPSQVQKLMDFDTYLNAKKCLELGLVDEVESPSNDE